MENFSVNFIQNLTNGIQEIDDSFKTIKLDIENLKKENKQLKDENKKANERIDELEKMCKKQQQTIDELTKQINSIHQTLKMNSNEINKIKINEETMQEKILNHGNCLQMCQEIETCAKLDFVNTQMSAVCQKLKTNESDMKRIETTVKNEVKQSLEQKMDTAKFSHEMEGVNKNLKTVGEKIQHHENDIKALRKTYDSTNNQIQTFEETINAISEKEENISNEIDNIYQTIETNENKMNQEITEIKTTISNLSVKETETEPEIEIDIDSFITKQQLLPLQTWTKKRCVEVLFDSKEHTYPKNPSVLNEKILGKNRVVFIIEDQDGEIFGYYENTFIDDHYYPNSGKTDVYSFQFNLVCKNGRFTRPVKIDICNTDVGYSLYKDNNNHDNMLIDIGDIHLRNASRMNESYCWQNNKCFGYGKVQNCLCGKTGSNCIIPKRLVVIQME